MRIVISDIETNGLNDSDKLWICGGKDLTTGEISRFDNCHEDPVARREAIKWYESADLIVGHNFVQFDAPMLNKLLQPRLIDPRKIVDTLLISRLVDYDIETPKGAKFPHSLQAWGIRLNKHKGDFHEFDKFSIEMVDYWYQDIEVTESLFNHFNDIIWSPDWRKSLRTEHDVQIELVRTQHYGFFFDKTKAEFLLNSVKTKMGTLEEQFQVDFPPKLTEVNRIKYRLKKDGGEMATVTRAKEKYAMTNVEDDDLVCFDWIEFNPGSAKDRIDVLWDAGWKPVDKTKTAIGARLLAGRIASPSAIKSEIEDRLDLVSWFLVQNIIKTDVLSLLKGLPDFERSLARLSLSRGGPRDLLAFATAIVKTEQIF